MAADLNAIVTAATSANGILFSVHYLQERAGRSDRPLPHEILLGLAKDAPRIVRDEGSTPDHDTRGPVCEVHCETPNGTGMAVRLNYQSNPIKMVTAFFR